LQPLLIELELSSIRCGKCVEYGWFD